MGIRDKSIAAGSPWQTSFAERLIGTIRRECVDHIVVLDERTCVGSHEGMLAITTLLHTTHLSMSLIQKDPFVDFVVCRGDWRVRTRSTRHFAASDCNVDRVKSQ